MGNRAPEGPVSRPLGIDVDPLVITGRLGKQVDTILVHQQPVGRAVALTHGRLILLH